MRRITTLLLTQLPLLLFSGQGSGGPVREDGARWIGYVCETYEEAFAAAYAQQEKKNVEGNCDLYYIPYGMRSTVEISSPFHASMFEVDGYVAIKFP